MANTPFAAQNTKVHMGGANQTVDQHLELYRNELDTRFQYQALFQQFSRQVSTAHNTDNYRIDRMNTSKPMSRKSGVALESQPVTSDKLNIIVDTTVYIRNTIDYNDDWTAPSRVMEMGENNGSEMAEAFDESHIIQLIKARDWKAPEHLKPAFSDGMAVEVQYKYGATQQAELEANAIVLWTAHDKAIQELIKKKVPLGDMVTIVTPEVYSALREHPKAQSDIYNTTSNGDYKDRRVIVINGVPVVEVTEFPTAENNDHLLGANFATSAQDIKVQMILFSKSKCLVTVEAQPFTTRFYDEKKDFTNVLDVYHTYTVGIRRPDCVVSFILNATT